MRQLHVALTIEVSPHIPSRFAARHTVVAQNNRGVAKTTVEALIICGRGVCAGDSP